MDEVEVIVSLVYHDSSGSYLINMGRKTILYRRFSEKSGEITEIIPFDSKRGEVLLDKWRHEQYRLIGEWLGEEV